MYTSKPQAGDLWECNLGGSNLQSWDNVKGYDTCPKQASKQYIVPSSPWLEYKGPGESGSDPSNIYT